MRKFYLLLALLLGFAIPAFAVGLLAEGFGKKVTVSTVISRFTGFAAYEVAVHNQSGSDVYVTVNSSTSTLLAASITNAIVIPAGLTYSFDTKAQSSIHSINLATTNGTAVVYVAAY